MFKAFVLTVSDRGFRRERPDGAGPVVAQLLEEAGYKVVGLTLVHDEQPEIKSSLCRIADGGGIDLLVTTGGTGFAPHAVRQAG